MKRVKIVFSGWNITRAVMCGKTLAHQGIIHSVGSANMRCMSTHKWAEFLPTGPKIRLFSVIDNAVSFCIAGTTYRALYYRSLVPWRIDFRLHAQRRLPPPFLLAAVPIAFDLNGDGRPQLS